MRQTLQKIIFMGLFSALVFTTTSIKVIIPLPGSYTMMHLGHVTCILAGLLLDPLAGGFAAAIGSALFDIFNPLFFYSAPLTFVFKFLLAFLSGIIYSSRTFDNKFVIKIIFSSSIGSLLYLILHLIKLFMFSLYFLKMSLEITLLTVFKSLFLNLVKDVFSILIVAFIMLKLKGYELIKDKKFLPLNLMD